MIYVENQDDGSFRMVESHLDTEGVSSHRLWACLPLRPEVYSRLEETPALYDTAAFFQRQTYVQVKPPGFRPLDA